MTKERARLDLGDLSAFKAALAAPIEEAGRTVWQRASEVRTCQHERMARALLLRTRNCATATTRPSLHRRGPRTARRRRWHSCATGGHSRNGGLIFAPKSDWSDRCVGSLGAGLCNQIRSGRYDLVRCALYEIACRAKRRARSLRQLKLAELLRHQVLDDCLQGSDILQTRVQGTESLWWFSGLLPPWIG